MSQPPTPEPDFEFKTNEDGYLLCPVCGYDYVHLGIPQLVDGYDGYHADKRVRGDVIRINGTCEDGCKFTLKLGFHKGWTKVWATRDHQVQTDQAVEWLRHGK